MFACKTKGFERKSELLALLFMAKGRILRKVALRGLKRSKKAFYYIRYYIQKGVPFKWKNNEINGGITPSSSRGVYSDAV